MWDGGRLCEAGECVMWEVGECVMWEAGECVMWEVGECVWCGRLVSMWWEISEAKHLILVSHNIIILL